VFLIKHSLFCLHSTTADVDYVTLVQNITFNIGGDPIIVSVDIVNDTISEPDETFEIFLKPLPGDDVVIGQPSVATGTIFDDERPSKTLYFYDLFLLLYILMLEVVCKLLIVRTYILGVQFLSMYIHM